eukprot:g17292.t1
MFRPHRLFSLAAGLAAGSQNLPDGGNLCVVAAGVTQNDSGKTISKPGKRFRTKQPPHSVFFFLDRLGPAQFSLEETGSDVAAEPKAEPTPSALVFGAVEKARKLGGFHKLEKGAQRFPNVLRCALEQGLVDSFDPTLTGDADIVKTAISAGAVGSLSQIPEKLRGEKEIVKAVLRRQIDKLKLLKNRRHDVNAGAGNKMLLEGKLRLRKVHFPEQEPLALNKHSEAALTVLAESEKLGLGKMRAMRLRPKIAEIGILLEDASQLENENLGGDKYADLCFKRYWEWTQEYNRAYKKGKQTQHWSEATEGLTLPRETFRMLVAAAEKLLDAANELADRNKRVKRSQKTKRGNGYEVPVAAQRFADFIVQRFLPSLLKAAVLNRRQTHVTVTLPTLQLEILKRVLVLLNDAEVFEILRPDLIIQDLFSEIPPAADGEDDILEDKEILSLALEAGAVKSWADVPQKLQNDAELLSVALEIDTHARKTAKKHAKVQLGIGKLQKGLRTTWKSWEDRVGVTLQTPEMKPGFTEADIRALVGPQLAPVAVAGLNIRGNKNKLLADFVTALSWVDGANQNNASKNAEWITIPKQDLRTIASLLRRLAQRAYDSGRTTIGMKAKGPNGPRPSRPSILLAVAGRCSFFAAEIMEKLATGAVGKNAKHGGEGAAKKTTTTSAEVVNISLTPVQMAVLKRGLLLLKENQQFWEELGFDKIVTRSVFAKLKLGKAAASAVVRGGGGKHSKLAALAKQAGLV